MTVAAAAEQGIPPKTLAVIASAIAIEGYDLSIYALFALSIARNFFPSDHATAGLLLAVATLGVGYLTRPLGGIFLGRYADRVGRKAAISLTVLMMSASTGLIALVPSYPSLGLAAPLLIVVLRLVQGFFSGGAAAGSISWLVESAPPHRRGFYASWQQASQIGAFLLSALVGAAISTFCTPEQLDGWAWRIPFLLALLFGPIGLYIKRAMPDPEAFRRAAAADPQPALGAALRSNASAILVGAGVTCLWNVTAFILLYYVPTWAQANFTLSPAEAFRSSVVSGAILFVLCPLVGALSDRLGKKRMMIAAAALLAALTYPALAWFAAAPGAGRLILMQSGLAVLIAGYTAPVSGLLAELFPVKTRSTGLSVAYNLSTLVVGGFGPLIVTALIAGTGNVLSPGWYVTGAALVSLVALTFVRDRRTA